MKANPFKDMVKYLPGQIVPGIVGFVSIPIITRLFAPGDYGDYVLVISTVSVFSAIAGWLSMPIKRFYPAYERDKRLDQFYGTVLKMTFVSIPVLSLLFLGAPLLLKSHISPALYSLMYIGVLVFALRSCLGILAEFVRVRRQIGWYSGFQVWKSVTTASFGILLVIIFDFGIDGLLWGSILSLVIAFPFLWRISLGKVSLDAKGISTPLVSEMARYGFPLMIGNLAAWILSLSDRYVLEFLRGSQEVGIYSVSYRISEHSIMLLSALFALTSGSIVYNIWEKEGQKKSQEFMSKLTRYYLLVGIPAVVGLSVLTKPLITTLAGQEYHAGHKIIPLIALGAFFLGLQQRFQPGIHFHKKTHSIMLCIIVSGLFNLGLNFLFIPKYGYMAAAVTTLLSYSFLLILVILVSRRFLAWQFPFKSLAKAMCASSVMGVVVYHVGNSLTSSTSLNSILGVVFGVVIYSLMLFSLREFELSEIKALLDLKGQIRRHAKARIRY